MLDKYLPVADAAIRADFDRMLSFASELRELARELADHSGFVHSPALDHDLSGHLHRVEKYWLAHRSRVQSLLSESAAGIGRVVAQYEKTNDTVAAAATSR